MRVRSWEQMGLEQGRTLIFAFVVGGSFFTLVVLVGWIVKMGAVSVLLGGLTGAAAAYLVSSAPRRIVSRITFEQTLEGPTFAASSGIYLRSTSSRSKTFLMLRAEEPHLRSFLAETRRRILTGYDAANAVRDGRAQRTIFSESVRTVLNSVVSVDRSNVESGSDELDGILNSTSLDEETKMPLLLAVSFFLPIMLMLFAAMTKNTGLLAVVALVVLEVVILDIVLSISRSSVGWAGKKRSGA